jgi:hypothetical protein
VGRAGSPVRERAVDMRSAGPGVYEVVIGDQRLRVTVE